MKNLINKFTTRNVFMITAMLFSTTILFSACKKESTDETISDEEVVEAITQSVSASSGGLVTQTETTASLTSNNTLACGGSKDSTISGQNLPGAVITYNYSLNFHSSLVCAFGIPSQFNASFTGTSSYTALRMSSIDKCNGQMVVTGLAPSASNYVLNANFVRNGTQQSSVRYQRSFTSTITITSANITVSKSTMKIISGSATVQFDASASGGANVSRGGTITFLGNNEATIKLNNGGVYNIKW